MMNNIKKFLYRLIRKYKFFYWLYNLYLFLLIIKYYFLNNKKYLKKYFVVENKNIKKSTVAIILEWRSWDFIVMLDFVLNIINYYKNKKFNINIIWNSKFKDIILFLNNEVFKVPENNLVFENELSNNYINSKHLNWLKYKHVINPFSMFQYYYWKLDNNNFYRYITKWLKNEFINHFSNKYNYFNRIYKIKRNSKNILCNFESHSANLFVKEIELEKILDYLEKLWEEYWYNFYVNKVYNKENINKKYKNVKIVSYSFSEVLDKTIYKWEFKAFISYRNWLNDIFWKFTDISQLILYHDSSFPYFIDRNLLPFNYFVKKLNYNKTMKSFYSISWFCSWYLEENVIYDFDTIKNYIKNFLEKLE